VTLIQRISRRYHHGGWPAVWAGFTRPIAEWRQTRQPRLWADAGVLSQLLARHWPLHGPPVLILSLPRSGSSWVGDTLGNADNAAYLREPLTQSYLAGGWRESVFDFPAGHPPLAYRQAAERAFAGLPRFDGLPGVMLNPQQWSLVSRRRRRLVIKEVNPYLCAWLGAAYRPRVILLLRHPAAIALSYRRQGWWSDKPGHWQWAGHGFGAALHAVRQSLKSMLEVRVVKYETLCAEPLEQFDDLFKFAGLQWDARLEALVRQRTSTSDDPNEWGLNKISSVHINRWRDEITPDELADLRTGYHDYDLPWYQAPGDW
jgi:hypothetical protein